MTIVDEEQGPGRDDALVRPWWFVPALVGVGLGALVGAALVPPPTTGAAMLASPDPSPRAVRSDVPSPTVAVRPSDLPLLPQEAEFVRAMDAVFVTATAVGDSRFDRALGPALPARVFDLRGRGARGAVDVLFLDEPRDIHVCATATSRGLVYRVSVDGRETSSIDAARPLTFLVDRTRFIIVWDAGAASAFEFALNIARVPC